MGNLNIQTEFQDYFQLIPEFTENHIH